MVDSGEEEKHAIKILNTAVNSENDTLNLDELGMTRLSFMVKYHLKFTSLSLISNRLSNISEVNLIENLLNLNASGNVIAHIEPSLDLPLL